MLTSDAFDAPAADHPLAGDASWRAGAAPQFPRLLLTSDLRAATGLPRTHMDYYLREGIIRPVARSESGYLLFDAAELKILRAVLRWREAGVGIREIRERLDRPASS
jgi:hypothetical protein